MKKAAVPILLAFSLLAAAPNVQAQWLTQTFALTNGWNAVFLHVDASHTTLDAMVGSDIKNPILEVWRWNPASNIQFVDNAAAPIDTSSQWTSWDRTDPGSSLQRMVGNSAYLVRVGTNVTTYTWWIQGKPVAPVNDWTTTGLNFVGFPTVPVRPPNFEAFLALAPDLQKSSPEIDYYAGGDLTNNPVQLPLLLARTAAVTRGQAYWIRAGTFFNRYFGPFELDLSTGSGIDFQTRLTSSSMLLKNLTTNPITVTVKLVPSEPPPVGQSNIAGLPPLLIRGSVNLTNLTYGYTSLAANGSNAWSLAPKGQPGSQVEVVLGVNRSAITNSPGALLAGVLRFTDSLGYTQLDAPVTATAGSAAGLWVGRALVTQVGEYLKTYARDTNNNPLVSTNGNYVIQSTDTSLGAVLTPFPLRLILHNPATGTNASFLQHVFLGQDANTNFVVATKESPLNRSLLDQARRISATHLPFSAANAPWTMNGRLGSSPKLTTRVTVDYNDQSSSPFVHSYHPDHDNLDGTFNNVLVQGAESYSVQRDITLNVNPPAPDFSSLVAGTLSVSGSYQETISVLGLPRAGGASDTRQFQVQGGFTLNRISDAATLTVVP